MTHENPTPPTASGAMPEGYHDLPSFPPPPVSGSPVQTAAVAAAAVVASTLAPASIRSVTLRDGRRLDLMRRATVRDLRMARRVVKDRDGKVDEADLEIAILATCLHLDGVQARFEDLQDVELSDLFSLAEESGSDFSASPAKS